MPRRVDGHVPEEGMETLHDTAIAAVWRLRNPTDATAFQIPNGSAVIEARDRVASALGVMVLRIACSAPCSETEPSWPKHGGNSTHPPMGNPWTRPAFGRWWLRWLKARR